MGYIFKKNPPVLLVVSAALEHPTLFQALPKECSR
jgi:hypothetical protein